MKRLGKASLATVALAASLTMLVAGCGSGSGGNSANGTGNGTAAGGGNGTTNTSTASGQPVDGGTLTMAQGTKYNDELIPAMDASLYTANVVSYAFDPLLTIDKNLNYIPDIIQKWTWSADKKTITMDINPNAK
ncbi:MAG: hypothetical protein K6T78_07160, partial [Alicyclobacillus sp.]|nr:hypothetical protein [Alicyclobacillus sp.]